MTGTNIPLPSCTQGCTLKTTILVHRTRFVGPETEKTLSVATLESCVLGWERRLTTAPFAAGTEMGWRKMG